MAEKLDLDLIDSIASRFGAITASDAKAMIARIRELESASQPGGGEARFEVRVDGNTIASAEGAEEDALREATHYFYQSIEDAEMESELVQVSRVLHVERAAPSAGNGGAEASDGS